MHCCGPICIQAPGSYAASFKKQYEYTNLRCKLSSTLCNTWCCCNHPFQFSNKSLNDLSFSGSKTKIWKLQSFANVLYPGQMNLKSKIRNTRLSIMSTWVHFSKAITKWSLWLQDPYDNIALLRFRGGIWYWMLYFFYSLNFWRLRGQDWCILCTPTWHLWHILSK